MTALKKILLSSWKLIRDAGVKWDADNSMRLSASLAYYTIFSLAPLLIFAIAIAGFFFGNSAARYEAVRQLQNVIGSSGAKYVDNLIDLAKQPSSTWIASIIGGVTLLVGAASAFVELQQGLNTIWDARSNGNGFKFFMRQRLFSFAAILAIGAVILALLASDAAFAFVNKHLSGIVPAYFILLAWTSAIFSFIITSLLFACIYKILPDAKVKWKDVWVGALVAAFLFFVGKYLIGLYLRHSSTTSLYGAAGSLVILLLWIYYSAQILFFGAEITFVWAKRESPRESK